MTREYRTLPAVAEAIQARVFGHRHATFAATPLLQYVRFMLIKARVPDVIFSDRTKNVIDFFFDPTIAKNMEPSRRTPWSTSIRPDGSKSSS